MKKIILVFSILSITLFFSCRKEFDKPSWDTEVLAPLIDATLDINDILPDSILQANADSSLKIVYNNDFNVLPMDTLFKIPDTVLHTAYNIPIPYTFSPGQAIVNNNVSETTYNLQDVQLRKVIIKSGIVTYKIKSMIHEVTNFVYSIPCATLNGVPFVINVSVPAAVGNTPGIYDEQFDLSGYSFDLTGINKNKVNSLYTSLTALVSPQGQPVLVNPTDSLVIENTFIDILPYYAKGYFGQHTYDIGPSENNFTLFSKIRNGSLKVEDVTINLQIENSIGMDARAYINKLTSINSRTNTSIDLSNTLIGSPINLNRAAESGGIVYSSYANFPLTVSNSNIKSMIENLPDKLGYTMQITTNPLGNVSGSNDFVYYDKLLKARLNMQIPLSAVATNLTLIDTLNFNLTKTDGTSNVHSGTLTMYANNGFPLKAAIQFYLLDENNAIADSIFIDANTIDEALVNSSFRVISKKLTKIILPVSEQKINLLYTTKKIVLKTKFNTTTQPNYIKIYSDYQINVKLVADFNYTVHL